MFHVQSVLLNLDFFTTQKASLGYQFAFYFDYAINAGCIANNLNDLFASIYVRTISTRLNGT